MKTSPDRSKVILAFESSCDETAMAAVDENGRVLFERLWSQIETHQQYGGVVPEVASRSHFEAIQHLNRDLAPLLKQFQFSEVVATMGPGLIGPLLVASNLARGLALGLGVPFRGIHHLRGHVASALMGDETVTLAERAQRLFPALVFLVSGGHTQILHVSPGLHCKLLSETADDAAGECLDKCAKLMGLPYPGGPAIEKLAKTLPESEKNFAKELSQELPRPKSAAGFSFSGLKTAFRLRLEKTPELKTTHAAAAAWALQDTVVDTLVRGLESALKTKAHSPVKNLVFCGGVAANQTLRARLLDFAQKHSLALHLPPLRYATDNAVMIAAAAMVQDRALDLTQCEARIPLAERS